MKKICIILILSFSLAGCRDLTGPEGTPGRTVEPDSFAFTVAGTPSGPLTDLSAFSAALKTALEGQPAGDSAANPIAVKVEGLYLARQDDLTALYRSLTRYAALDLSGCRGTVYAIVENPNREKIVSLTLPASVVLLEPGVTNFSWAISGAFFNYTSLASVDMPGLEYAGANAFYGCTSLAALNLPALASAGSAAFSGCIGLTALNLPALASVDGAAFSGCTGLTALNLPTLASINGAVFSDTAFSGCTNLAAVDFPALVSINGAAFSGCTNLADVDFPALASINGDAFRNCTGLTALNLTALSSIEGAVFSGCTNLAAVDFPELVLISGTKSFLNCTSLATVRFPKLAAISFGSTSTTGETFENCSGLNEIILGPNPPSVSRAANIFTGIPAKTITFKVPGASVAAYQAWSADSNNYFPLGAVNGITRIFTALD